MRESETEMRCYPPRMPFWQWPVIVAATVAVFGGIIFSALLMVSELVTHYQTTQQTKLVLLALSATFSIALLFLFIRWEQDRWYWVLDTDRLIGGKNKDKVLLLSAVAKIVPGLPNTTNPLVAANRFLHPKLWATVMAERKLALLLKFADGSFMPFHVHRCVNGCPLMTELVKRLPDRVDRDYEYTQREIKALQSADWNRIVRNKTA